MTSITSVSNKCDFTKYAKINKKPALTDKYKKKNCKRNLAKMD